MDCNTVYQALGAVKTGSFELGKQAAEFLLERRLAERMPYDDNKYTALKENAVRYNEYSEKHEKQREKLSKAKSSYDIWKEGKPIMFLNRGTKQTYENKLEEKKTAFRKEWTNLDLIDHELKTILDDRKELKIIFKTGAGYLRLTPAGTTTYEQLRARWDKYLDDDYETFVRGDIRQYIQIRGREDRLSALLRISESQSKNRDMREGLAILSRPDKKPLQQYNKYGDIMTHLDSKGLYGKQLGSQRIASLSLKDELPKVLAEQVLTMYSRLISHLESSVDTVKLAVDLVASPDSGRIERFKNGNKGMIGVQGNPEFITETSFALSASDDAFKYFPFPHLAVCKAYGVQSVRDSPLELMLTGARIATRAKTREDLESRQKRWEQAVDMLKSRSLYSIRYALLAEHISAQPASLEEAFEIFDRSRKIAKNLLKKIKDKDFDEDVILAAYIMESAWTDSVPVDGFLILKKCQEL